MPSFEVPFRAPTAVLFFIITILAVFFSFNPPTELIGTEDEASLALALRRFAWASGWFFVVTGPLSWLKSTVELLSTSREPMQLGDRVETFEIMAQWGVNTRVVLSGIQLSHTSHINPAGLAVISNRTI